MALKTYRPTTPSTRQLVLVDRSHLHKGRPAKHLTEPQKEMGGRNNLGRIVVRWRVRPWNLVIGASPEPPKAL